MTVNLFLFVIPRIWLKRVVIIKDIMALIKHFHVFCGMATINLHVGILKVQW